MRLRCLLLLLAIALGLSSQPAAAQPCTLHGTAQPGTASSAQSGTDVFTDLGHAKVEVSGFVSRGSGSDPLHPLLHPEAGWCHVVSAFVPARGAEVDRVLTAAREFHPIVYLCRRTSPAADIFRPPTIRLTHLADA
jgi:hypothetical protein